MTNERIAATASAVQLGLIAFVLVPQAAALGLAVTIACAIGSAVVIGGTAAAITKWFSQDDPWREVGLDPFWDAALEDLSA